MKLPRELSAFRDPLTIISFPKRRQNFLRSIIRCSIEIVLTDDRLDLVGERIDIALRAGRLEDSSMMARKLAAGFGIVCASPGYLASAPPLESIADIKRHDCIIHGKSVHKAKWLLEGPSGQEHVAVAGRIAVNSMMLALRASIDGMGLVLVPSGIAEPEVNAGRLARVLPDWQTPPGGLFLVYPSHRHQSAAARAFIDFIVAKTSLLGWLPAPWTSFASAGYHGDDDPDLEIGVDNSQD